LGGARDDGDHHKPQGQPSRERAEVSRGDHDDGEDEEAHDDAGRRRHRVEEEPEDVAALAATVLREPRPGRDPQWNADEGGEHREDERPLERGADAARRVVAPLGELREEVPRQGGRAFRDDVKRDPDQRDDRDREGESGHEREAMVRDAPPERRHARALHGRSMRRRAPRFTTSVMAKRMRPNAMRALTKSGSLASPTWLASVLARVWPWSKRW